MKTDDRIGLLQAEVDREAFLREDVLDIPHKKAELWNKIRGRRRGPRDSNIVGPNYGKYRQVKRL